MKMQTPHSSRTPQAATQSAAWLLASSSNSELGRDSLAFDALDILDQENT